MKIIAFQTITNHSFYTFYIGGKPVVYMINRKIHGCLEIPGLFLVLNMIFLMFSTRNKSGISAHHVLFSLLLLHISEQSCPDEARGTCLKFSASQNPSFSHPSKVRIYVISGAVRPWGLYMT